MTANDISVRPAKQQIIIGESSFINYGIYNDTPSTSVRRTQAYVLRSLSTATVVLHGNYVEIERSFRLFTCLENTIAGLQSQDKVLWND